MQYSWGYEIRMAIEVLAGLTAASPPAPMAAPGPGVTRRARRPEGPRVRRGPGPDGPDGRPPRRPGSRGERLQPIRARRQPGGLLDGVDRRLRAPARGPDVDVKPRRRRPRRSVIAGSSLLRRNHLPLGVLRRPQTRADR